MPARMTFENFYRIACPSDGEKRRGGESGDVEGGGGEGMGLEILDPFRLTSKEKCRGGGGTRWFGVIPSLLTTVSLSLFHSLSSFSLSLSLCFSLFSLPPFSLSDHLIAGNDVSLRQVRLLRRLTCFCTSLVLKVSLSRGNRRFLNDSDLSLSLVVSEYQRSTIFTRQHSIRNILSSDVICMCDMTHSYV